MWQGCNVPCSEAMMNDASTGCKGAWYTTQYWPSVYNGHVWDGTGNSCTQKCASLGLRCDLETIKFTTTFDRAKSVLELMGEFSTCASLGLFVQMELRRLC